MEHDPYDVFERQTQETRHKIFNKSDLLVLIAAAIAFILLLIGIFT